LIFSQMLYQNQQGVQAENLSHRDKTILLKSGRYWTRTSDLTDVNREAHFCHRRSHGCHVETIRVNGGLRNRGNSGGGIGKSPKQPPKKPKFMILV
jgi:hypothetical protein